MLLIFSLLIFYCRAYWSVNSCETSFTWSHPRWVAFQFNQEPSWLLRYRHLAFSTFVSLRWITHEPKTSSGLKDPDITHRILEQAMPFFPLFHKLGTPIWKFWPPQAFKHIHGTVNSSIELLLTVCPKTIRNTTWMNLCPNLKSSHDSLKNRNLKNVFPIPRKSNLPKNLESA